MSRPIYRVADIYNGSAKIRFAAIPGRPLGNYSLPYWPVRSFISCINPPAELPQVITLGTKERQERIYFRNGSKAHSHSLREDWDGIDFEVARGEDTVALKATNYGSESPILIENFLSLEGDSPRAVFHTRATNKTEETIPGARMATRFCQDFNWSHFGQSSGDYYWELKSGAGESRSFYAFSSGMKRGFEFLSAKDCQLAYEVEGPGHEWSVELSHTAMDLAPGESIGYRYTISWLDRIPESVSNRPGPTSIDPAVLNYRRKRPGVYRKPELVEQGIGIQNMFAEIWVPKARGLNLRYDFPEGLEDLETLAGWGCNLLITDLGEAEQTRTMIRKAHELGMKAYVQGRGNFASGPPHFDELRKGGLKSPEIPDGFGQDEDHYYWSSVDPLFDFKDIFEKKRSAATQEESVRYWSRCFLQKWRMIREEVRDINPEPGVWFYTPTPGIAHVDPLDYYDVFMDEVGKLGEDLTVFPFYYGVEYDQVQYMIRRWKDHGLPMVVFLPMRDFMTRPGQFFRSITAARRGGADGTCGFSFSVSACDPGQDWQWKSVMLAAQANFPTPEMRALVNIEEPARLVEALAARRLVLDRRFPEKVETRLDELLPNGAEKKDHRVKGGLEVKIKEEDPGTRIPAIDSGKGMIAMKGESVVLSGGSQCALDASYRLLVRYALLAEAELSGIYS